MFPVFPSTVITYWEFLCSFESLQWDDSEVVNNGFRLQSRSSFHNLLESLKSLVLSAAYISFNLSYVLRNLCKIKGRRERNDTGFFSAGPRVGFCLIMLTICQENGVRSQEQTRLIYFTGLSTQPNYCITNSDSFTPWRSTLISACDTGAGVCYSMCMLTSFLYHSQTALTAQNGGRHLLSHLSDVSKWTCLVPL